MTAALTDDDFRGLREHLAGTAGLVFDESRRVGLAGVVAERLRATGLADVSSYLALVRGPHGEREQQRLLDRVTVQETYFFRNLPQIEALRGRVLPDLLRRSGQRDRPLTIWSAGCSTGEEAYTLAMLVADLLPRSPGDVTPSVRIVGTDVSAQALAVAERATYAGRTLHTVPAVERDRWFVPRSGDTLAVRDDVRRLVQLQRHNLVTDPPPFGPGEVDLVVCRNVTIYFSRATTRALVGAFHDVLADGGYLMLGHAETLWQVSDAFTLVPLGEAFVYRSGGVRRRSLARPPAGLRTGLSAYPGRRRLRPGGPLRRPPAAALPAEERVAADPAGATAPVIAPPATSPSPRERLAAARAALAAGDYREAVRLATSAAGDEPLLAEAYIVQGHALATLGRHAEAVEPLRKAVYLDPAAGHAHFLLAGSLAGVGQQAAAAVSYRAAAATLAAVPAEIMRVFLGGRAVADLVEVCQRLAAASAALSGEPDVLAGGRNAS